MLFYLSPYGLRKVVSTDVAKVPLKTGFFFMLETVIYNKYFHIIMIAILEVLRFFCFLTLDVNIEQG